MKEFLLSRPYEGQARIAYNSKYQELFIEFETKEDPGDDMAVITNTVVLSRGNENIKENTIEFLKNKYFSNPYLNYSYCLDYKFKDSGMTLQFDIDNDIEISDDKYNEEYDDIYKNYDINCENFDVIIYNDYMRIIVSLQYYPTMIVEKFKKFLEEVVEEIA